LACVGSGGDDDDAGGGESCFDGDGDSGFRCTGAEEEALDVCMSLGTGTPSLSTNDDSNFESDSNEEEADEEVLSL